MYNIALQAYLWYAILDTVVYFPKSGKRLVVSKNYSAYQLAQIDSFLSVHTIKTITSRVTPNLQNCADRTFYNWEVEPNQYQTTPGKYLGIVCDYLTPSQCLNYGFNQLFIPNGSSGSVNNAIQVAINARFSRNNLMVDLGESNSAAACSIITGIPSSEEPGYYYIDEPFEKTRFGDSITTVIPYLANLISSNNPSAKLFLSSFTLPFNTGCNTRNYLAGFEYLFSLNSNIYVQCDAYPSDCCYPTTGYWDKFNNAFGAHDISNWMSVTVNNGSTPGSYPCAGYPWPNSSDWSSLFGEANAIGMNNIWLYAYQTGNQAAVSNFAYSAWTNGFVLNLEKQVFTEWKCTQDNCTDCVWPNEGVWYIYNMYYTGVVQYVGY